MLLVCRIALVLHAPFDFWLQVVIGLAKLANMMLSFAEAGWQPISLYLR